MSLVKIELVGAIRYGYKSEKFERNVHYMVKADRAATLLNLTTDNGFYVFREVGQRHTPVAAQAAPAVRSKPVVDTTKSAEETYDESVAAAVAASAADDAPVVVQPSAIDVVEPDITEEEALKETAVEEVEPIIEDVVVEEINVAEEDATQV